VSGRRRFLAGPHTAGRDRPATSCTRVAIDDDEGFATSSFEDGPEEQQGVHLGSTGGNLHVDYLEGGAVDGRPDLLLVVLDGDVGLVNTMFW
jgi:hypothetical protein